MAVVGALLAVGGVAHFWTWTGGAAAGKEFSTELAAGSLLGAAPELAAYAQAHPAYVAALVVGVALVVRRE
jgi:hypothetical protein